LVIPFMINDNETVAWIDFRNKKYRYNSTFLEFEGFTCAYVIA
jgi:4'-phosphopantetheinyl transferase